MLARGGGPEPGQVPLAERLTMAIPSVDLLLAWASVLAQSGNMTVAEGNRDRDISTEDENDTGGHTLPCRLTRSTPHTAARPGVVSTSLTPTQTAVVIVHCRLRDITFGNAYLLEHLYHLTGVSYQITFIAAALLGSLLR
ncbi:hypothetical protein EV363DRAFT_773265 [Boletus edulis]|nr:hypothetical protein EV363DRAFT_773265 [Boletus edulis]